MTERRLVTRVAAYGLVRHEGRILLCRMSDRVPADAGLWTLPGGGLDFGEDPAEAMVREVFEETGLRVLPRDVAGIDSLRVQEEARSLHGIRILYRTELLGGTLRYEVDGSTDRCAWWTLAEARDLPLVDLVEAGLRLAFPEG
jgi:ADP-ribose pyrophosphatase YjhB (NUDIX family)